MEGFTVPRLYGIPEVFRALQQIFDGHRPWPLLLLWGGRHMVRITISVTSRDEQSDNVCLHNRPLQAGSRQSMTKLMCCQSTVI